MAKRKSAESKATEVQEHVLERPLHPRHTALLCGHPAAEDAFLRAYRTGTLHHAWLLTGEQGIGKATFAYRAARFLLSRDDGGNEETKTLAIPADHPVSRQVAAGAHPSLFVLGEDNAASIGVEAVRKLRAFLSLTSPGGWRAMIVDPANDLTIASANALLKAIEEPPPRTVFFLVSHGAAAVMPTIRSRCVKLAFRALSGPEFQSAILAACAAAELDDPGRDGLSKLYTLSGGVPGRAIELMAGDLLPLAEKLDKILNGLPRVDYAGVHGLIQSSSGARNTQTFTRLCDLIEDRVEEAARREARDSASLGAAWAQLWQTLRQRRTEMEALNLDKGAYLLSAFSDIERIARNPS